MRYHTLIHLAVGILVSGLSANAQHLNTDKARYENGILKVGVKDVLGSDRTAWLINFFFNEVGIWCDIPVISKEPVPTAADGLERIMIECDDDTLIFLAQIKDDTYYEFSLSNGILKNNPFDQTHESYQVRETQCMYLLARSPIRSITINGFTLPGPYPTPTDFANIFNTGLSDFPGSEYFNIHRQWLQSICKTGQTTQPIRQISDTHETIRKVKEEAKELTIHDLIMKPLGVMPEPENLWDTKYIEVMEYAESRSNWINSSKQDYRITLFGNHNYGEVKDTGYNMLYHGEPIFCVQTEAASYGMKWGNGLVENYSYSFERGIKGKVPKYDSWQKEKILDRPQWTQQEAIAFAQAIVGDLASHGIRMIPGKKQKGDVFMMEGIDRIARKHYRVKVFKSNDDYSAFFMVDLAISSDRSQSYADFND